MKRKLLTITGLVIALTIIFVTPAFAHDGVGGDELAAADVMWVFGMAFFAMALIAILYSWHNGEFRNPEKAKYTMLEMGLLDEDGEDLDQYVTTEAQY
jgi:Zn-dependent protease with chaperone function